MAYTENPKNVNIGDPLGIEGASFYLVKLFLTMHMGKCTDHRCAAWCVFTNADAG